MTVLKLISQHKAFDGIQTQYQHQSSSTHSVMTFSIYLPLQSTQKKVPVLYWLSGLTSTDENFSIKAGAQRFAAEYGVALVMPDTSPRGDAVANDSAYDLGQGASFYVNATETPWKENYQMYNYIVNELPDLIEANFPVTSQRSIFGHSMGGHGALMIGLKNPDLYAAASAFAPIVNPSQVPWGRKAFTAYLGADETTWVQYDSLALCQQQGTKKIPLLIDQGTGDEYYPHQLQPENFAETAHNNGYDIKLNLRDNYDHSYYFVSTYIHEHFKFHIKHLKL